MECLCIYSSCRSKHFRLPDGSGDSDLAFDPRTLNATGKFDTVCVIGGRMWRGRADRPIPKHKDSLPQGHYRCLRVYRGGKIVKHNVCGQSERNTSIKSEQVLTKTAEGYGPLKERLARKQNSQPEPPFHLKCETHGPLWKYTSFKGRAWCVKDKTKHMALLSWKNIIFRRYSVLSLKVARGLCFILQAAKCWDRMNNNLLERGMERSISIIHILFVCLACFSLLFTTCASYLKYINNGM